MRETKTVNGVKTRYIYNGADIVGEIFDDNIYTYYRATELIGYTNNKGDRYYYRQNSHGDVTALLTVNGHEKKTYSYNAYGKENPLTLSPMGNQTVVQLWKAETEQVYNPFRYCGEYQDTETGLIYLRNRYYDNSIGRFITEDPIKDGLNWYVYANNNPIMLVDPWGLSGQLRFEPHPQDRHDNSDVYLRDMFDFYKQNESDKIDVYDDFVDVSLNNKSQRYYYNTDVYGSVHGNRISGKKMIVDAVEFGKHFGLTKTVTSADSKAHLFSFIDGDAGLGIASYRAVGVSWNFSIAYVDTPTQRIVYGQHFWVKMSSWPNSQFSTPTMAMSTSVQYFDGGKKIREPLLFEDTRPVLLGPDHKISTYGTYHSRQKISLPKTVDTAKVKYSVTHNEAFIRSHSNVIEIKFK